MRDYFDIKSNLSDDEDFLFDIDFLSEEDKKSRRDEILELISKYQKIIGELTQEYYSIGGSWKSDDGLD